MGSVTTMPLTEDREYRGRKYTFRELEMSEYDALVEQATSTNYDAEGNETEVTDQSMLQRLMLQKSLVEPKLALSDISSLGTRLGRQLERDVQYLHFAVEPLTGKAAVAAAKKAKAAAEEDAPN